MSTPQDDQFSQMETTCGTLLYELKVIWDEVGESDAERDKMLYELEQECVEVYRRKVDQQNRSRAQLRQTIADYEAELASICSAMGERPVHLRQCDQDAGSLKEELSAIVPELEEMRKRKCERRNKFIDILQQIQKISYEIGRSTEYSPSNIVVDETDLSLRKLEEFHRQLQSFHKEKEERLKQVLDHLNSLNSLCLVLGMDFKNTLNEVHPSLDDSEVTKNMSDNTIERLAAAIQTLRKIKRERMQKLQDLATTMLELWNLMDTPIEEQKMFQNVTCNIAASEHEITEHNILSEDFINYVEAEVSRLEELKASKMKELVLKKRSELDEICRRTHMVAEADGMQCVIEAIESGAVDPASVLEQIELQIANSKEEAFSRKEILEKVEKWLAACEEECWLEEYNRDENRYNAGRGGHLILKRAEKARSTVNKLPAMVDALASKTIAWERERGVEFTYDGIRLLAMLEEYSMLRQEKERKRRRQRDEKKLQGQLMAEQEVLFGSKPSPSKPQSVKKAPRTSTGGPSRKRLSLGGAMLQTPKPDSLNSTKADLLSRTVKKGLLQNDSLNHHEDEGFAALPTGRRGLDSVGLPVKQHSLNAAAGEIETPMTRKPFSPVSKSNTTNLMEDMNKAQKIIPSNNMAMTTPSKLASLNNNEENMTPKAIMSVPVPSTPSTVSVPMQTAITPAPSSVLRANTLGEMAEVIEYSFEERRAGFILPQTHLKSIVQV
ncbi:65-kDa microtubule-associated protein 3-like [Macadamia integrifolia]|uniref:65-kDa microtubule-associated protein 3-like n=1 Tax=Macadamia integrifolia TaxID=60698 RepID=UPI001C52D92C|nr:65-kDa microtubule-associated protein 3-like [Macadamia integrifolia]XP_042480217.1 65-kDa microtubule-associated protein 3-like [Macadamia integrifolia]